MTSRSVRGISRARRTFPTLSGFAVYLDTAFKVSSRSPSRLATSIRLSVCYTRANGRLRGTCYRMRTSRRTSRTIWTGSLTMPQWRSAGKTGMCTKDLFPNPKEWPNLSEIGSLHTYIFKGGNPEGGNPEGGDVMPPIRMVKVSAWKEHKGHIEEHLVAEITLPMRLLFHQTQTRETFQTSTTWIPAFDYYTMNVTTSMLTQSTWFGRCRRPSKSKITKAG